MLLCGAFLTSGAEDKADGLVEGTSRVVGAILEYTRWNGRTARQPDPVRVCVIGPAIHAGRLEGISEGVDAELKPSDLAVFR